MSSGASNASGTTNGEVIARSPADVLRLVVAAVVVLLLLIVSWLVGDWIVDNSAELLSGLGSLPEWLVDLLVVGTRLLTLALVAGVAIWIVVHGRWRAAATMALAGALAAVLVPLLDAAGGIDDATQVVSSDTDLGVLTSGWFPSSADIGVVVALLTAGAPWLGRRVRRLGWLAVVGLVIVRSLVGEISLESVQAAAVGWLAGAAALVILGAPTRRPTARAIADGLARVGLPLASIEPASVDARGSTPYFAVGEDGGRLFVKALGQDERSADLLFRLYRWAQHKDLGDERPFSSLRRAVEHEALVAFAARDLGIRTPRMRAVTSTEPNSFVLAYDSVDGRSVDRLSPDELTDDVLAEIWRQLAVLRHHRIAHRDLRLANLFLGADGAVWFIDFGFSELAASDLLIANDVAELVASSSTYVGVERAVAPAIATVDARTRAAAAERLHPWALSGATRTALKERPGLLDELRRALVTR